MTAPSPWCSPPKVGPPLRVHQWCRPCQISQGRTQRLNIIERMLMHLPLAADIFLACVYVVHMCELQQTDFFCVKTCFCARLKALHSKSGAAVALADAAPDSLSKCISSAWGLHPQHASQKRPCTVGQSLHAWTVLITSSAVAGCNAASGVPR